MANIPIDNLGSSEIQSALISGITEALNAISNILDMKTVLHNLSPMQEVYISDTDRYRIYAIAEGKRLWQKTPAPVIRKNGNIINPATANFTIDYIGGSITFDKQYVLINTDSLTATVTAIKAESAVLVDLQIKLQDALTRLSKDKGYFADPKALIAAHPSGVAGDNAIVGTTDTVWVWDVDITAWVDSHKATDFSNYYTKPEIDNKLNTKENTVAIHGTAIASDNYFYGGRKQWIDLFAKVRETTLTGFVTTDKALILATDTMLTAIGKLQAQIADGIKPWAKKDVGTALKTDGDILSAKIATQAESETATADNVLMSPLKTKQEINKLLPLTSIGTLPTVTNIPVATNDPLNTAIAKLQKQTSNIYPTGGADGQILIKDGAVDQAVKYSTEKITDLATKDYMSGYVSSRGSNNLITNGNGAMGNNYNFPQATFIQNDVPDGCNAAFVYQSVDEFITIENIPINPKNKYQISGYFKAHDANIKANYYVAIMPFDIDNNLISVENYKYFQGTITTLAQPVKNGDTKIYLTSLDNWQIRSGVKIIGVYPYTNSFGYTYPVGTYTRKIFENAWTNESSFNLAEKSITLSKAWTLGDFDGGTNIVQPEKGLSYMYPMPNQYVIPTDNWRLYTSRTIGGIGSNGKDVNYDLVFPSGTTFIKVLLFTSPRVLNAKFYLSNLCFEELNYKDETDKLTKRIEQLEFKSPKIYGIRWDGVSSQCKRLYDAENISVNVANFCHRGSVNASYSNPFDNIMPWKGRKVCNVDLGLYQALQSGDNIRDCVTAWEGYPNFKWDGSNGEVMVYTPEFWTKQTQQSGAWDILISDSPIAGWNHIAQSIGGRWFAIDDGTGSLSSKAGMPLTNVAMSTLHAKAKTKGMTVENIYTYSAENVLFAVEYATLNSQEAIGNGDDSSAREASDKPSFAETGANRVIVTNAIADFYTVNCTLDIGTSDGANNIARRTLLSKTAHTTAGYTCLNFDGAPINITTAQFISAHGIVNTTDSQIGSKSGYLGANGKSHAYYRGRISHAGRNRYILGAYRQKDTGRIWLSPPPDCDDYDALDVEEHLDTGFTLHYNMSTGAAVSGYIKTLAPINDVALAPVCTAIGGNTSNPVGDYYNMPALATVNTVLRVGGGAGSGVGTGRFCAVWINVAGDGGWLIAVLPFLKNP